MGLKTAECFGKIFKGEPVEEEYYIPCEFRLGESCGCDTTTASDIGRRKLCRLMPRDTVMAEFRAGRIHFMENAVLKSERYSTLGECLREFFYVKDGQEGNPFYIFIDPALGRLGECDVDELPAYSFSGTYDMLVGKNGPVHYEAGRYNTLSDGLIPEYSDASPHMMVFMPLYIESFLCGYLVMSDNLEYINSLVYSKFKAAFNRILETYIKNLKLSALNDRLSELLNRDPMTSVMNRVAYENCKAELTDALAVGELKEAAFVMFDVNDLKYVNDTYGHEKGDEYIKNSCSFICSYFKHSPVFRIGGDEFLAVLRGEDYNNRENILARFRDEIERLEATRKRPENRVSIACGMAGLDDITEPADITIDAVIKLADERMYDDKRKIKSRRRERK